MGEMLPLETKHFSGGKLLPLSVLRWRVPLEEVPCHRKSCWWGNPRGRDRWVDPGVDGRIIFGWIFRRWDKFMRTGLGGLRIGTGGGRLFVR